jgi:hypothetical protein
VLILERPLGMDPKEVNREIRTLNAGEGDLKGVGHLVGAGGHGCHQNLRRTLEVGEEVLPRVFGAPCRGAQEDFVSVVRVFWRFGLGSRTFPEIGRDARRKFLRGGHHRHRVGLEGHPMFFSMHRVAEVVLQGIGELEGMHAEGGAEILQRSEVDGEKSLPVLMFLEPCLQFGAAPGRLAGGTVGHEHQGPGPPHQILTLPGEGGARPKMGFVPPQYVRRCLRSELQLQKNLDLFTKLVEEVAKSRFESRRSSSWHTSRERNSWASAGPLGKRTAGLGMRQCWDDGARPKVIADCNDPPATPVR